MAKKATKKTAKKAPATSKKKVAKKAAKKAPKKNSKIMPPSHEEIASRAYHIYTDRMASGQTGDAHSDWQQALQELS